jgi:hypothetical protein
MLPHPEVGTILPNNKAVVPKKSAATCTIFEQPSQRAHNSGTLHSWQKGCLQNPKSSHKGVQGHINQRGFAHGFNVNGDSSKKQYGCSFSDARRSHGFCHARRLRFPGSWDGTEEKSG